MDFFASHRTPSAKDDEGYGLILTGVAIDPGLYEFAAHHVICGRPDYRMRAYTERLVGDEKEARLRFFCLQRMADVTDRSGGPRHFRLVASATARGALARRVPLDALRMPIAAN